MSTQTSIYQTYDSYKDSSVEWIGDIPKDWDVAPLKALLNERKEKNNPVKTEDILSLSMHLGVIPYEDKEAGGNKAKSDLSAYNLAYPGDIVMNSMNVIAGSVGLSNYFGAISPVYYAFYQRDKSVDIEYVDLIFQSEAFQKSLLGLGNGILVKTSEESGKMNTIRMRIPAHRLKNLPLPFPKVETQKKIKTFLNDECGLIDQLIQKKQQLINLLQEKRQALITQAVTKGLDPKAKMKDSGVEWIGEMPEKWELWKLKHLCLIYANYGLNIPATEYQSDGVRFIRTSDIDEKGDLIEEGVYLPSELLDKSELLQKGDLLLSRSGTIGRPYMFDQRIEACFAGYLVRFRLKKKYVPKYLKFYFLSQSFKGWIETEVISNTISNLNGNKYANAVVPLPPLEEMNEIVHTLDVKLKTLDTTTKLLNKHIKKLNEYKSALIYNAVTGKIKV